MPALRRLTVAAILASSTLTIGALAAPAAPGAQPASESAVALKTKFIKGMEVKYRVKIDRTDTNILNSAVMTAPPAPAAPATPAPKPAEVPTDAPKSDPAKTDPAPNPTATPGEPKAGVLSAAQPATPPPAPAPQEPAKAAGLTAVSRVSLDTVQMVRVIDATDAGATLEVTIDAIKADITIPAGTFAYDSTRPEDDKDRDNVALQTFKPALGLKLTLTADKDGVITAVTGGEQAQISGSMSPYLQQLTASDNLRIRWNMILNAKKGGGTFKVGETWSDVETIPARQLAASFEVLRNSTLRAVAGGKASVDMTGSMRLVPADPAVKPTFEIKDANILATGEYDTADGMTRTLNFNQSFRLEGNAQGMSVTRQSEVQTTVERM